MAKGIEKVSVKFCVETAVYWGNPVNDGYGFFTFDAPVERACRWENKSEVIVTQDGREFTCNASLLLTEDVDLQGFMWRGTLADLAAQGHSGKLPIAIPEAYMIRRFDRIPMVKKNDEFVRMCWLYYYGK
jgi:hypothetical protein